MAMPDDARRIRVLTFNTLFRGRVRARMDALARLVDESDYDIVCLQEVISPPVLARFCSETPSFPYMARAGGFPLVRGGLVTLSRWPIVKSHFHPFALAGPARPEWLLNKGALFTRIRLAGGWLTAVNTHLSANMDMDWSPSNAYTKVEQSELARLAAAIKRIDPAEPLIAMGDFNVPRDSRYLTEFASAAGLRDALAGRTEPTYRPECADIGAIDQFLHRPGLEAEARLVFTDVVRLPDGTTAHLSDHYGLAATVTL
ncbi:endonuclease/exonuclease/phosphatase family protein [Actinomadura sp. NAK00032]|uniref:endonuclease/exonuclease/phosphatase family protein n=1 Tax=Actinomadura sp. NAK00032 TaxID=2742128 RepID=UPI001591C332|nr:endonuclease/exonuclease/phosphatase family protein [Actinomadura sp. NAK00032]QKW39855.1 endonuclease/exonuclease/phosphatase family protein [Actinomadura sp. NAK00032]